MVFRLALVALCASLVAGCAYPRRATSLTPVGLVSGPDGSPPADVWQIRVVSAEIPPRKRGGLAWDDDDPGLPDALVRIYRGDTLLWTSEVVQDSLTPRWNAAPSRNLRLPRGEELRIELWDQDGVSLDTIGVVRRDGVPLDAVPDSDFLMRLDGGATLTVRVERPLAHRGVGVTSYEVRGDALVVLEVEPYSPAGRAGLRPGDRIVSIGGQTIEALGEARAASALSLASDQRSSLEVVNEEGRRTLDLDHAYTWLSM